jgi:hypothetical protein
MPEEIIIDLSELYQQCSDDDKEVLVEWLTEDGYCYTTSSDAIEVHEPQNYLDHEWAEIIKKLAVNRLQLTLTEEDQVKEIVKRLV